MQTKIDLCGAALLKIGERAIAGFNEDSAAAQIAGRLCDQVIDGMLSAHAWRFATRKYALDKTSDGDFLIPSDVLRILSCDRKKYDVRRNRIVADGDKLEITCVVRTTPESFPPYFAAALTTKLAMEFCVPLTLDKNNFAFLNALYENELRFAKFLDSSFGANQEIENFSLINTRF